MTITTTAIAFSLISFGILFCGICFFRAFQKIGGIRAGRKIGVLLSVLLFTFAAQLGTMAIGTLFFIGKPLMFPLLIADHFLLAVIAGLGIYLIFYILFPLISPWPAVLAASALGSMVVGLTIITHPHPFIDASGGVNWDLSRWLDTTLSYLLFIDIGPLFIIFMHAFLQTRSREVKVASFVQVALASIGIINVFVRFTFPRGIIPEFLRTRIFDATLGIIGLVYICVFFLPMMVVGGVQKLKDSNKIL